MKISACYIVKNEAANIKRSIESLKEAIDELIVVDTGSTDDTVPICEELGAKIHHFEWINDFAAARNHAIAQATGDIIIFLDADEWFVPALGADERKRIEAHFANKKNDCVSVVLKNIDRTETNTSVVNRIIVNKSSIRYKGRIHEHLDGVMCAETDANLCIHHSGYVKEIFASKIKRNTDLLKQAYTDSGEGSQNRIRFAIYLIREHYLAENFEDALKCLLEILKNPGAVKKLCAFHNEEFISGIYYALLTGVKLRNQVSRLEIKKKLFSLFKEVYTQYPGSPEAPLLYNVMFDLKENIILKDIRNAVAAAQRLAKKESVSYYKSYETFIFEKAAIASWRRNDGLGAIEFSVASLKDKSKRINESLALLLLTFIKNQPVEEIILLLNSIYDINSAADLEFLIRITRIYGLRDVFTYYAKKRMETGAVRTEDYLSMMLAHQKYDAVIKAAFESVKAGNAPAARYILVSAVCGAPHELLEPANEILSQYSRIFTAYQNGARLENVTADDANFLRATYPLVAFATGIPNADKYLNVFRNNPALCFIEKGRYCENSGSISEILNEDMSVIDSGDYSCRRYLVSALVAAKRYDEALAELEKSLATGKIIDEVIHTLLVVAEQATGDTGAKARTLYTAYVNLFDTIIDLGDVVRTGVSFDVETEIQKTALKKMSTAQFDALVSDESKRLSNGELLDLSRRAAIVYRRHNRLPEAVRCLLRLVAHGAATGEDREELSQVFVSAKNKELGEYVRA